MVWQPSTAAYEAGLANRGQYFGGSAFREGDVLQLPPVPYGIELAAFIHRNFAGVSLVGLRRGATVQHPLRDAAGNLRKRDVHEEGRALDVMVSTKSAGNAVANWAVTHARELGIQRVIWDHVRWRLSETADAWMDYTGPNPHTDHVHIEVLPLGWSREQMAAALAAVGEGSELPVSRGETLRNGAVVVGVLGALWWIWSNRKSL